MLPLYSSQQVKDADYFAINELQMPSIILMENAARSIFDLIIKKFGEDEIFNIGIVCGKGNNGGDGFTLARHFLINDFDVQIISLAKESELKGDALTNFIITKNLIEKRPSSNLIFYNSIDDLNIIKKCDLVVDAILGTGSRGNLTEQIKLIVEYMNNLPAHKVAIDIPTGLNLENSTGEIIFNADLTVTLGEMKTGLFYNQGYVNSGKVVKGSIGIGEFYFEQITTDDFLIESYDAFFGLPKKLINSHKYSTGKVLVIAGSGQYVGAACLAANSVLRSGAGSCFLAFPKSIKNIALEKLESPVIFPFEDSGKEYISQENILELNEKINWADAIAIGPGLGRNSETVKFVHNLLNEFAVKKMVVDADALFAISKNLYKHFDLKNKILTPHHKEFADLIDVSLDELKSNILPLGKKFATDNSCYLVLKGAPTIIFNPKGQALINSSGNPGMAKFGTGDVLTGIIAGFIAQSKEIDNTLISAVYLHSLAADRLIKQKTEYGIIPQHIIEEFPNAIKYIIESFI